MKRVLPLLIIVTYTGCAAPRAEKAPAASPSSAPATTTLDEGSSTNTGDDASKVPAPVTPGAAGGASGTVVMPELAKAQVSFDEASHAFSAAGNDCAQLCKALGSMTHATDRLCELAGDDKRCSDAKTRLDAARAKVKSTCGSC